MELRLIIQKVRGVYIYRVYKIERERESERQPCGPGIHMLLASMAPLTLVTLRYAVDYGSYMKRLDVAQHLEYPIHVHESATSPFPP